MKTIVLFFLTFICVVHSLSIRSATLGEWNLFKLKYNKSYETEEEDEMRFIHFLENKEKIALHNIEYEKGETTFFLEMNEFGDMTSWEFANRMYSFNMDAENRTIESYDITEDDDPSEDKPLMFLEPANVELPNVVDWRKKGAVTRVKLQEMCGAGWAFSATGSLEGQHFRHKHALVSLSEQNLIDCSRKMGNMGCHGGLVNIAFNYIKLNGGIDTERSYPYKARDEKCRFDRKKIGASIKNYVEIPKGDEKKLQAAVATEGPISVAIDADTAKFVFYKGGVYYSRKCSSKKLNHGVLVVGYGTDSKSKLPYWLVKNSWGTNWGEKGYVRMIRNHRNNCGIATSASYPILK